MDLPLRPKQVDVPVADGDIVLHFRPLDDAQLLDIYNVQDALEEADPSDEADLEASIEAAVQGVRAQDLIRSAGFLRLFAEAYTGATCSDGDPLTVGGEPFDPAREEHVLSLPFGWRLKIFSRLVSGSAPVTADLLGNSEGPASRSPKDTAPSTPSPAGSAAS